MTDGPEVYCPLVTPFDDDAAVDERALANLVDHLVAAGVDGMVPCGTTGEFATLTDEERRTVVRTVVDAADGRVPVMAGVGGTAVEDVRERVLDAEAVGADSVLVPPPYYGGQASTDGNEGFVRAALVDTPLPAYLYNIPSATGQTLQTDAVVSLAEQDAIAGIKDSSGDVTAVDEILRRTPASFTVYQGWDAVFVPTLAMGADGGINALAHLYPETLADAAAAVADGDLDGARTHQFETIDPAFRACAEHGFGPVVKAVLAERDVIPSATVRPPRDPLSGADREAVLETLDE